MIAQSTIAHEINFSIAEPNSSFDTKVEDRKYQSRRENLGIVKELSANTFEPHNNSNTRTDLMNYQMTPSTPPSSTCVLGYQEPDHLSSGPIPIASLVPADDDELNEINEKIKYDSKTWEMYHRIRMHRQKTYSTNTVINVNEANLPSIPDFDEEYMPAMDRSSSPTMITMFPMD
jgi:hypothetical protein